MTTDATLAQWENTAKTHKDMRIHYHIVLCTDELTGFEYIKNYLTNQTDQQRLDLISHNLTPEAADKYRGIEALITLCTTTEELTALPQPGSPELAPESVYTLHALDTYDWTPEFQRAAERYVRQFGPRIRVNPLKSEITA